MTLVDLTVPVQLIRIWGLRLVNNSWWLVKGLFLSKGLTLADLSTDGTLTEWSDWFIILQSVGTISFRFTFSSMVGIGSSSLFLVDAALIICLVFFISSSLKVYKVALVIIGSGSVYSELVCWSFSLISLLTLEILLESIYWSSISSLFDKHSGSDRSCLHTRSLLQTWYSFFVSYLFLSIWFVSLITDLKKQFLCSILFLKIDIFWFTTVLSFKFASFSL